ncbi:MAG TPA: hypothetical protein VMZ26_08100 [Pyrinomonadaceae bacterium]|nr:hypothetical protein [Pyrinomonadaceae bacterium]
MLKRKTSVACLLVLIVFAVMAPTSTDAKTSEYKSIVRHLKTKYRAKKVNVPLMWLARFAVSMVRPAGVKSFSVTLFEDLKFSRETVDKEMQSVLRSSFTAEWSPILRARSAEGQQAYMYMREDGKNVKIALVTIDKENAAVIRATFSPDRLAEFMNDPKVFGISLNEKTTVKEEAPKKEMVPAPVQ